MAKTGRFSNPQERDYYTTREMAQMLKVSCRQMVRLARKIPGASQPTGRRGDIKFFKDEVVPWLKKQPGVKLL